VRSVGKTESSSTKPERTFSKVRSIPK
jgi:hypothetical protein